MEDFVNVQTLSGHSDCVTCVTLTLDGMRVVSGSYNKTVRVWDLASGRCLETLSGHDSYVTCVALTLDGKTVVSGSDDETVCVWDLASGRCLQTLSGHSDCVSCVALTSDGMRVVSGSYDKTVRVWHDMLTRTTTQIPVLLEAVKGSILRLHGAPDPVAVLEAGSSFVHTYTAVEGLHFIVSDTTLSTKLEKELASNAAENHKLIRGLGALERQLRQRVDQAIITEKATLRQALEAGYSARERLLVKLAKVCAKQADVLNETRSQDLIRAAIIGAGAGPGKTKVDISQYVSRQTASKAVIQEMSSWYLPQVRRFQQLQEELSVWESKDVTTVLLTAPDLPRLSVAAKERQAIAQDLASQQQALSDKIDSVAADLHALIHALVATMETNADRAKVHSTQQKASENLAEGSRAPVLSEVGWSTS